MGKLTGILLTLFVLVKMNISSFAQDTIPSDTIHKIIPISVSAGGGYPKYLNVQLKYLMINPVNQIGITTGYYPVKKFNSKIFFIDLDYLNFFGKKNNDKLKPPWYIRFTASSVIIQNNTTDTGSDSFSGIELSIGREYYIFKKIGLNGDIGLLTFLIQLPERNPDVQMIHPAIRFQFFVDLFDNSKLIDN